MKIVGGIIKVCLVVLALPWIYAALCKVLAPAVVNTYGSYVAWVGGVIR